MLGRIFSRGLYSRGHMIRLATSQGHVIRLASTRAADKKFDGKVAVVTGSTEGIGYAVVEQLALGGANVVVSSRSPEKVENAVKQLKEQGLSATGITCQVGDPQDRTNLLQHALSEFGRLDMVVTNAAASPFFGPFFKTSERDWDKVFDTNVKATFFLVKEAMPELTKTHGSVVVVSTILAYFPTPSRNLGAYSVSKAANLALVKAMAPHASKKNVRVNCVAPGLIKTAFSTALRESDQYSKGVLEGLAIKRFGEPEEVADSVCFLLSDDARYITGETLVVAGGWPSRM